MQHKITVIVETRPDTDLLGIKEDLAYYAERFGDIKSVDVEVVSHQTKLQSSDSKRER